jgi:hypothetical protein
MTAIVLMHLRTLNGCGLWQAGALIKAGVRRLQPRIAKAVTEGWWIKVRILQHLLTHSYSGKILAVK